MDILPLILISICLGIVAIVLTLPPYWPLKQRWSRYQQIKMVTLGLLLIDIWVFLKILTVISHALPTPYDKQKGLILSILVPCLCFFLAATIILGIVLIVRRKALLKNETEGNGNQDNKPLRNRLVIGILALLVAGIAYQGYQLSQPAPELPDYNKDFGYDYSNDSIPESDIITPADSIE